jgi:hypothetical protein
MTTIDSQQKHEYEEVEISLGNEITGDLSVIQIDWIGFNNTFGVPVIFNGFMALSVSSRLNYMQKRIEEAQAIFSSRFSIISAYELHHMAFTIEDVIMHMKRIVDEFFTYEWLRLEGSSADFQKYRKVRVSGVNEVDSCASGPTKDALLATKSRHKDFMQCLINLRNSFVHHPLVALSYDRIGVDHLTINTVITRSGVLKKLTSVTLYLEDLLKSFNRFMSEVFLQPRT